MIGQQSIKQTFNVDVAITEPMASALATWALMYENKAPWLNKNVHSLNLPASIAGEIARAVTIELIVEISGSARATYLAEQFGRVLPQLRQQIEYGCAKGGLMFKPYIAGDRVVVDYVQADMFYPVAFDANGNITACIFADQQRVGQYYYTRLEYHRMTGAGCEIRNMAFRSMAADTLGNPVGLDAVDAWKDLIPEATITGIDRPLFAYFRFPLANSIDPTSPLGVSCYSRAVELIEDADIQWSNLIWEFESGRRAIYVDALAFDKDATGKSILPDKRLYRTLKQGGQISDEEMFHEWTPEFREASIISGLDAILKRIEYSCGLAYGTLSDPQTVDKTATEIKTSKQRTYATITDTQKALQSALDQLIWAMDVWATIGNLAARGAYETAYQFDDSVIVDTEKQFSQDLHLVTSGIMSKVEWRMRNFRETEAVARQKIQEAQAERQPETDFFQE